MVSMIQLKSIDQVYEPDNSMEWTQLCVWNVMELIDVSFR